MARRRAIDFLAELRLGGPDDGNPEWGTQSVPITTLLRDFSIESGGDVIDAAGLGDAYARLRFSGNAKFTIRGTLVVDANTYPLVDAASGPMIGHYIQISVKPDSTANAPYQWAGIITRWELTVQRNDLQEIRFEVQGPFDA